MDMYDVFETLKARGYVVNTYPVYSDDPGYGYLDTCAVISRRDQEKFPFHYMVLDCLLPDYSWWDHYACQEVTPEEVLEFFPPLLPESEPDPDEIWEDFYTLPKRSYVKGGIIK